MGKVRCNYTMEPAYSELGSIPVPFLVKWIEILNYVLKCQPQFMLWCSLGFAASVEQMTHYKQPPETVKMETVKIPVVLFPLFVTCLQKSLLPRASEMELDNMDCAVHNSIELFQKGSLGLCQIQEFWRPRFYSGLCCGFPVWLGWTLNFCISVFPSVDHSFCMLHGLI